jgi:chorismate mutase
MISQKALDLGMDGLMIESHIHPERALTDMAQQLSPGELEGIINSLAIRQQQSSHDNKLEEFRTTIDELDEQLLEILSKRMQVSALIGKLKKTYNLAPYQAERWVALLNDRLEKAAKLELDKDFIKKIYETIHMESIKKQE